MIIRRISISNIKPNPSDCLKTAYSVWLSILGVDDLEIQQTTQYLVYLGTTAESRARVTGV